MCDALSYLLDNICIRFGAKLYGQIAESPMGTNCTPLVADLFLYCYEIEFMDFLNYGNQADVMEAFKKVQVGKDQEKAQLEKRFPLQKPRREKTKPTIRYLYHENIS